MARLKLNLRASFLEMPIDKICSYYKFLGILDPRIAFDNYLIDTSMRPKVDSPEFREIFNNCAKNFVQEEIDFYPNLYDNLRRLKVMCSRDAETKIWHIVWEDGTTGTFPPTYPPDPDRFI